MSKLFYKGNETVFFMFFYQFQIHVDHNIQSCLVSTIEKADNLQTIHFTF